MSETPTDTVVRQALRRLAEGARFTQDEAYALMSTIMEGKADTAQLGALLMGLRVRGETVDEITGFARAMREKSHRITVHREGRLIDTCGTGGAPTKTFNVSTASAFVAAGAGAMVAKHGNRSVTSPCGSADVLEALGADLARTPAEVARIVEKVGVGFLFAPGFHPAMKHAIPARKALGVRTVFNVLGPLTNPAGADAQVMGVFDPGLVTPLAQVLANLGTQEAMVVHGGGGLDEVSTLGPTQVAHARGKEVRIAGLPPPQAAAEMLRILGGAASPRADLVALNAACALVVAGLAHDVRHGLDQARGSIDSGAAKDKLAAYVAATGGTLRRAA